MDGKHRTRRIVVESGVPKPGGPYSHVVVSGGFAFVSGQGPKDARTGRYAQGGIGEQTGQALRNLQVILGAIGLTLSDVVKVNAFLRDINDFQAFNDAYAEFFVNELPARTTVQAVLPNKEMLIEIEVIAKTQE